MPPQEVKKNMAAIRPTGGELNHLSGTARDPAADFLYISVELLFFLVYIYSGPWKKVLPSVENRSSET
jgi:hypothetical protein